MDVGIAFLAARQVELLALGCAATDEDRVEPAGGEKLLHALDTAAIADLGAHPRDVADFLGKHGLGQAKRGNVRAHQAARHLPLFQDDDLVAEREQVVRHRERGGTGTDACDSLAVLLLRDHREPVRDRVLVVGRNPLQATDRDGLVLDPTAATRRFAGAVADPAEDAREDVRLPVDHVGIGELTQRDQADVFRHVGVRRTRPLAVHDPVEIVRVRCIGRLHG